MVLVRAGIPYVIGKIVCAELLKKRGIDAPRIVWGAIRHTGTKFDRIRIYERGIRVQINGVKAMFESSCVTLRALIMEKIDPCTRSWLEVIGPAPARRKTRRRISKKRFSPAKKSCEFTLFGFMAQRHPIDHSTAEQPRVIIKSKLASNTSTDLRQRSVFCQPVEVGVGVDQICPIAPVQTV